ncbi:hypothetical protein CFC21_079191 [Triticum aestivum]|uniref:F-box associated domain-containing protein n=2 Tax=Triticum aestivum TaxID=4565 RepID=A0A9R1HZG5_WHEAT|nr:F-box protein PP2-B1-like [Triticum aestivum]KAF7074293.1 hypothetical protein CFC21_079191 [Triticum aestivum]
MRLDRATGAKCFLISARALHISRGETPASWQWIHLRSDEMQGNERFSEAVRLRKVSWLEICAKMQCRMLSQNSAYATYMVFKLADSGFNKLDYPFQVASVGIGWYRSTRKVCLQGYMEVGDDGVTRKHIWRSSWEENWRPCKRSRVTGAIHLKDKIVLPWRRADCWMEVELGEFYNEEGGDGEVSVGLMQTTGGYKSGLVVLGVEIRSKQ